MPRLSGNTCFGKMIAVKKFRESGVCPTFAKIAEIAEDLSAPNSGRRGREKPRMVPVLRLTLFAELLTLRGSLPSSNHPAGGFPEFTV
jgi:hypothetical protein